jgi:urease accessory protein
VVAALRDPGPARRPAPGTGTVPADAGSWAGRLELAFERRAGRTALVRKRHHGPLMVQSPFYPGDGACHVYVLHPPGGLVGGDRLTLRTEVGDGAHALLTTPAATKVYRSDGRIALQHQSVRVAESGACEWLPQESLVFSGARARLGTEVELAPGSRFLGWEQWCLGRPASGAPFADGWLVQSLEVRVAGTPRLVERQRLEAGSPVLTGAWGLGGRPAGGTLIAYPGSEPLLAAARRLGAEHDDCRTGASIVDGLLVCRALAASARPLAVFLARLWAALRPLLLGCAPVPPRIWAT